MQQAYSWSDLANFVGIVFPIMGVALVIYKSAFGRKEVELCYAIRKTVLLGKNETGIPKEIVIKYNDIEIDNLSRYDIIIWNSGRKVIRFNDIVPRAPIRLSLSESTLRVSIEKYSSPDCEIQLKTEEQNHLSNVVSFLYLEPDQGVSLEVLSKGDDREPSVKGKIIGAASEVILVGYSDKIITPREQKLAVSFVIINVLLVISVFAVIIFYREYSKQALNFSFFMIFLIIFLVTVLLSRIGLAKILNLRPTASPKDLRVQD